MTANSTSPRAAVAATLLFFVGSLAYLWLLRGYGFQVEDEGTLLMLIDRVFRGQVPYVDFHTGYTPAFFYGGAAVFSLLGRSLLAMRTVLVLLNALSATALYVVGRRVVGPWMAALAPALWLVLVPAYPGDFAAFNIPYPTWPATLLWMIVVLALLRWERTDQTAMLVVVGLAVAALLAVRPNSGAFALASATWVVCALARRASLLDHVAAVAAAAFMALGVWFTLDWRVIGTDAAVHVLPALALAVCYAGALSNALSRRSATRTVVALSVLAGAFLVPTAAWMLHFRSLLGTETFLREVLLIGADYATLYYEAHPALEPYAALMVVAAIGVAGAGYLVRRRVVAPMLALAVAVAATCVVAGVVARYAVMPEGMRASLLFQAENALFWLTPMANLGGLALLVRRALAARGQRRSGVAEARGSQQGGELGERAIRYGSESGQRGLQCGAALEGRGSRLGRVWAVVVASAVAMYLQLYPRSDFMHQITAAPLSLLVGVVLLDRVLGWWEQGSWPADGRRVVRGALLVASTVVIAAKLSLTLPGPLQVFVNGDAATASRSPLLPVCVEAGAEDDLEAFERTAAFVRNHTAADETVWAFPATSGVLFAADRTSPLHHDYWFPGRPDHGAEAEMLAGLRADPPRYLVTLNDGWTFFTGAPAYFAQTREFVTSRYRLVARLGRFDVMALEEVAGGLGVVVFQPSGTQADAIEPQLARRRQAARRWMAALTVGEAATAELPADTRSAVLLLRALRDGGDIRAAGWLIAGYRSADARVRHEALNDMEYLAEQFEAGRLRWAGDFEAADYAPFVQPYAAAARTMLGDSRAGEFARDLLSLVDPP